MCRAVEIVVRPGATDALIADIRKIDPVIGIQVQKGSSVAPKGDVVKVTVPNDGLHDLVRLLQEHGVGLEDGTSITSSELVGVISQPHKTALVSGSSDASWEEMQRVLAKESSMTANALLLMSFSGAVAAFGIAQGAPHLVIAGMVLAPGFEPMTRIGLGLVAGGRAFNRGLVDTAKGYAALLIGALLATIVLLALGENPLSGPGKYDDPDALVRFWTAISLPSLLVSFLAGTAGAVLVATNRSVLTIGAMVALALIPSAALMSMSLLVGEWGVFSDALLRWVVDIALVVLTGVVVMFWKKQTVMKRNSMM